MVCDAGVQHRRLPHAARSVEQRQPRGHEVRGDDVPFCRTTEEEGGVFLPVWHETYVRLRRQPGLCHHAFSSSMRALRLATYASRETSTMSTSRLRHDSSSMA